MDSEELNPIIQAESLAQLQASWAQYIQANKIQRRKLDGAGE